MKKLKYDIVHKDSDLVVLNKPAGLLSIPDRYDANMPNVLHSLRKGNHEVYTVHRLDRDTSGLMIFALNTKTHKTLSLDFENRKIYKIYRALVYGILDEKSGLIDVGIGQNSKDISKMQASEDGKASLSEYKVIKEFGAYSLVEIRLHTGRTHQIRVHFQHLQHPMLVDKKYGYYTEFLLSNLKGRRYKRKREVEERPLMSRTSLHAYQLGFNHPTTKKKLEFTCPYPKDFKAVITQLEKLN